MKTCLSALALLLACGTTTAHAAGSVSASINFTNLAFSVSDLTPSDGVDPFFEILPASAQTSTVVFRSGPDVPVFFDSDDAPGLLANAAVSKDFGDSARALAQVTPTSVQAQATGQITASYLLQSSAQSENANNVALIRITPGTRLNFSGNATLQTTLVGCSTDCYAQAVLEVDFGYLGEEGSYTKTLFSGFGQPNQTFAAPVGLSYANTSSEDQFLGLSIHADVELGNVAVPVPEPATWALCLGGGLLALGARRTRRRGD